VIIVEETLKNYPRSHRSPEEYEPYHTIRYDLVSSSSFDIALNPSPLLRVKALVLQPENLLKHIGDMSVFIPVPRVVHNT
jgi:hypothetical protein